MAAVGARGARCGTAAPSAKLRVQGVPSFRGAPVRQSTRVQRIQHRRAVVEATSGKSSFDPSEKIDDFTSYLEKQWEETEQKPAAVAVILAGLVALYAVNGVVGSVEKIPIFGFVFEIVGILVSGWFAFRYLVFESDRAEFKQTFDDFISKIKGN